MKYSDNEYLVLIGPLLRGLERKYDDAVWEGSDEDDPDMVNINREIARLKQAEERGEIYDPTF